MGPEQNLIGKPWLILTKLHIHRQTILGYVPTQVKHLGNKKPPLFSEGLF